MLSAPGGRIVHGLVASVKQEIGGVAEQNLLRGPKKCYWLALSLEMMLAKQLPSITFEARQRTD